MVDLIFALLGPTGGLVAGTVTVNHPLKRTLSEGGNVSWNYMRELRTKAWQIAGLDPDSIWTRGDALHYLDLSVGERTAQLSLAHSSTDADQGMSSHTQWNEPTFEPPSLDILSGVEMMSPSNIDWDYLGSILAED